MNPLGEFAGTLPEMASDLSGIDSEQLFGVLSSIDLTLVSIDTTLQLILIAVLVAAAIVFAGLMAYFTLRWFYNVRS